MLERDIGLDSLLPSEDAAWILDAILLGVHPVVSGDGGVIGRGPISLGFNFAAPSVVHPTRLVEALGDEFALAVYPKTG